MEPSAPKRFRFGPFELDPQSGELRKAGRRVPLPPQAFRLLVMLVSRQGELISREQIQKEIWGGVIVDFEHSTNKSIRQIREALHDSADAPKFIETLPRRGYRFIAETTVARDDQSSQITPADMLGASRETPTSPPAPEPQSAATVPSAKLRRRKLVLAFVLLVTVGILVSAAVRWHGAFNGFSRHRPIRSLAVLPLANFSGDPSQDFFADGVTEELTTDLAKIAPLRVTSHTSALAYKTAKKPLPDIANELRVDAVVEGAVVRSGDRVRITAQLIRAATDEHLWAENYERDLKDLLALQDEVARDIAAEINIKVAAIDGGPRSFHSVSPEIHDEYLKGRFEWNKRSPASLRNALGFFQRAAEKDSVYGAAYAGLADTYALLGVAGYDGLPISEAMAKAKAASLKAIEIDDTLSDAHSSLAFVTYSYDWNWHEAEKEFQRALALNPSNATAHQWYSEFLCALGRWPESIAEAESALALDPNSPIIHENLARPYYYSHRPDDAIAYSKKTLELDPNFAISHLRLGRAYAAKHMFEEASIEFQRYSDLVGGSTLATASLANIRARSGDRRGSLRLAGELRKAGEEKYVPAYQFAIIYAGLGDANEAIKSLEDAYRERNDFLLYMKNEPLFDSLRSDPRFQAIERRIGLKP